MKILFMALLFFFSNLSFSQWYKSKLDSLVTFGTIAFCSPTKDTTKIRLDTVPVILLCSDTSAKYSYSSIGYFSEALMAANESRVCFYKYGYSVGEIHNEEEIPYYWDTHSWPSERGNDYSVHKYYLDADKNPLSKNIIVWDAKIIDK
jgi:hypothetical protein